LLAIENTSRQGDEPVLQNGKEGGKGKVVKRGAVIVDYCHKRRGPVAYGLLPKEKTSYGK